jgi:hypothetical protein
MRAQLTQDMKTQLSRAVLVVLALISFSIHTRAIEATDGDSEYRAGSYSYIILGIDTFKGYIEGPGFPQGITLIREEQTYSAFEQQLKLIVDALADHATPILALEKKSKKPKRH